tara:strand:- start:194 stop:754 length:561 start_codon:yes stop_codon:yes gene_type:complete
MHRRQLLILLIIQCAALILLPLSTYSLGGIVLEEGSYVPDFNLIGSNQLNKGKQKWSLNDFHGKWLVLYFYPRDFTSGCTIEARGFQNLYKKFLSVDAEIVGISADTLSEHESFCSSEELEFTLLSDPHGTVSKAFGSWLAPYSLRHTFLIDPDGILRYTWRAIKPSGHAVEVLEKVTKLQNKTNI